MGWIERIYGDEEPRIPVHQLLGSINEARLGNITVAQVVSDFNLTAQDQTDIGTLLASGAPVWEVEFVLMRAEARKDDGSPYAGCGSAAAIRTRLGI